MTDVLEISRPRQKASDVETRENKPPRIVIVGGGLAGLAAARALRGCDAEIVLIDRRNHHIFQPLLYQAATANIPGLSGTSKNGPTHTRPGWSVLTPSMLNIGEGATPPSTASSRSRRPSKVSPLPVLRQRRNGSG
jgi:choline dehydrogenase-like flavoprotein